MNEHIYVDSKTPVISLVSERLTDGSVVWNIHLREAEIACKDEKRARQIMGVIAGALKDWSCNDVLHL